MRTLFDEALNLWVELVSLAKMGQWKDSRLNRLAAQAWRRVLRGKTTTDFVRRM